MNDIYSYLSLISKNNIIDSIIKIYSEKVNSYFKFTSNYKSINGLLNKFNNISLYSTYRPNISKKFYPF